MNESRLQWVIAGIGVFVAVCYFLWLCMVYVKFMDTDRFVRATIAEHYASTVTVVPEKECEDCPDASEPPGV